MRSTRRARRVSRASTCAVSACRRRWGRACASTPPASARHPRTHDEERAHDEELMDAPATAGAERKRRGNDFEGTRAVQLPCADRQRPPGQTLKPESGPAQMVPSTRMVLDVWSPNHATEVTMSLNLEQKQAVVAEVARAVAGAQAIVMAENRGLPVADMTQLRARARASGIYFRVVKNTLVRRAVADTPFAPLSDRMVGPLAYGIGTDPVAVAKVLNDFAKGNEKFVIAGGAMPGQLMSAQQIAALASLPSREELLARLVGTLQAPITKLVRTMNEVPARFARTVAAVRDRMPA